MYSLVSTPPVVSNQSLIMLLAACASDEPDEREREAAPVRAPAAVAAASRPPISAEVIVIEKTQARVMSSQRDTPSMVRPGGQVALREDAAASCRAARRARGSRPRPRVCCLRALGHAPGFRASAGRIQPRATASREPGQGVLGVERGAVHVAAGEEHRDRRPSRAWRRRGPGSRPAGPSRRRSRTRRARPPCARWRRSPGMRPMTATLCGPQLLRQARDHAAEGGLGDRVAEPPAALADRRRGLGLARARGDVDDDAAALALPERAGRA